MFPQTEQIALKRISNASYYDKNLIEIPGIEIPPRPHDYRIVYHLYIIFAEHRNELLEYCIERGIEAKVHYPIPIYRQPGLSYLGYKEGDFLSLMNILKKLLLFPCDQHLEKGQMDYIIKTVKDFYDQK